MIGIRCEPCILRQNVVLGLKKLFYYNFLLCHTDKSIRKLWIGQKVIVLEKSYLFFTLKHACTTLEY